MYYESSEYIETVSERTIDTLYLNDSFFFRRQAIKLIGPVCCVAVRTSF